MHSSDVYIYICPDLQHTQTIYQLAFDNWWRKYNSDLITIYYFFTVRPWREQIILNLCLYKVSGQSINGLWHSTLNNSIILGPDTFLFLPPINEERKIATLIVSTEFYLTTLEFSIIGQFEIDNFSQMFYFNLCT